MKRTSNLLPVLSIAALLTACGSSSHSTSTDGDGTGGASHTSGTGGSTQATGTGGAEPDAGTGGAEPDGGCQVDAGDPGAGLATCPVMPAQGAIDDPGVSCYTVTPAQTGAGVCGQNATVPSYALFPDSGTPSKLVLFLHGSGGAPGLAIANPEENFYTAATSQGYAVIALSYFSNATIESLCKGSSVGLDACYFPTRKSIILGVPQSGAAAAVGGITVDVGIAGRLELALSYLKEHDPKHDWGQFLSGNSGPPGMQIAWGHVTVAGHSQGGGHAAAIGKLFTVERVVQLSSVCDNVKLTPASWTSQNDGPWATDPTGFYGLAAPTIFTTKPPSGDTTCPAHKANWANLGMKASLQHDDAATCGITGDTHSASIKCKENYPAWQMLLQ